MRGKRGYNDKEQLKQELKILRSLCDEIDEPIYVSDPETYEVLFANKKLRELAGEKILGKKCYKVFQNLTHPCPFCTNKYIFGKNLGKTYIWEFQNRKNKRWYRCIDKAIKWPRGRHARFEIAIDITEHKEAEETLRETNLRLEALIQAIPDIVYFKDAQGRNLVVNSAFEKLVGLKQREIVGKTDDQLFPKDLTEPCRKSDEEVLKRKKNLRFEEQTVNRKGEKIFFETIKTPLYNSKGKVVGLVGISRDITQRKKMEEALKESEQLFRSVVENSHDGILIIDDNFKITYANNETTRISGYKKEEIIGQDFRKFLSKEVKALVEDRYLRRQRGETVPPQYEFEITRKDGKKRLIEVKSTTIKDSSGKVRTVAHIIDITKRREAEEKIRESEERYRNLFEKARDIFITFDLKGNITSINKAIREYGFKEEELIGKSLLKFVSKRYWPKMLKEIARISKGEPIEGEIEIITPKGKKIAEYKSNPIRRGNKIVGIQTILRDITERKRFEESLSALNMYGQSLNMARNLKEIYNVTLKAMKKTLGFEYASILMVEEKNLRLVAHHGYSKQLTLNLPLDGKRGITVKAARIGKPVLVPDIRKEKAYVLAKPRMLSELAVPIKLGNKVLGVLNVESKRLSAFDENDTKLLEILASHTAIAISNLRRRDQLKKLSERLEHLMKSATEIMHVKDVHKRLKVIVNVIRKFGWRRVVISLRDENLEGTDLVTAGLTKEEIKLLLKRKAPGHVWRERLGPKFERFKIGEFYYLPWSDPWIREHVHGIPPEIPPEKATTYAGVPSKLSPEEMVDWHPQDMLYAPLRTPEGRIVGILSMDDPVDGRKPTREDLVPLELFLHQAAIVIENAQLIKNLEEAQKQLERKVEERTRELKKSQKQLLKAQRLAVIGELAGMVGHDLRNPLTSIVGATYYLKKRLGSKIDGKIKEMLELIERNIVYSNKIINDLLDYSREIKLDLTENTPKAILREALFLIEIPKNIQVIDLTENKPKMKVDIEKIKRAFVNLIKNAIEAMPKGGTLTIKSRRLNGNLEITFADTGVGISKKTMEKLWMPLFTTKAKGMGFGLPICKRIIEAHGGSISVKSTLRKGTTFTVTIPIKPKIKGGEKIWVKMPESSLLTTTKT